MEKEKNDLIKPILYGGDREKRHNIELLRFIGIIFIMAFHSFLIGYRRDSFFKYGWVWVDFYFMITGAFAYLHYQKYKVQDGRYGREALSYTFRKFKKFVPLTIIAVLLQYCLAHRGLIMQGNLMGFFKELLNSAVFEMMYLSSSGISRTSLGTITAQLAPIWFLSAMFIVLPLILYIMQAHPEFWKITAFTLPIIYFGNKGVNTSRIYPNDMLRAFVCIALGTMAVLLAEYIIKKCENKNARVAFSLGEIAALVLAVYISVFNKPAINVMEPLFLVICALMLSGCTWSSAIKSKYIEWLGKLSMPMFLLHWVVGSAAKIMGGSIAVKTMVYYGVTILLSICWVAMTDYSKKRKKRLTGELPKCNNLI